MSRLVWDQVGSRTYETGVDRAVLFLPDSHGAYVRGVAWNGFTTLTESPTGADANAQYADNIKYLNLLSVEQFGGTIEALTFPVEFEQFDGQGVPTPGVSVAQQHRRLFGLCYRTIVGNDVDGNDHGYKIHCVYGAQVSPSDKAFATVNDTPAPINFSWPFTTTPVAVSGMKPSSLIIVDSTKVDPTVLAAFELQLYGTDGVDPMMPSPDAIIAMFADGVTQVTATMPSFNSGTHTITIPTVAGVAYYVNDEVVPSGALVITADTIVHARPTSGHVLAAGEVDEWFYDYV